MNSSLWKEVQNRGSVVNSRKSAVSKEQKSVANPTNPLKKKTTTTCVGVRSHLAVEQQKTHNCSWAGQGKAGGQGSSCPGAFGSLRQHFIASSRLGATLAVQNLSAETVRTVQHTKPSNNQPKAGGAFIIGFDRGFPAPSSIVCIYINPLSTALQIQLSNRSGAFS